jgi:hypothetical protein
MVERFHYGLMLVLCAGAFACGSGTSAGGAGTGSALTAGRFSSVAGVGSASAGTGVIIPPPVINTAGSTGTAGTSSGPAVAGSTAAGSGGSVASASGSGGSAAGTGGASAGSGGSSAGAGGSSAGAGGSSGGTNTITGTLGALGAAKPIMNAWATTNGPETLIYLSSAPLSCPDMMTMGVKWLSKLPAGTQVIELVVPGTASTKMYSIGPLMGEVNYAEGSKSSATEVTGKAGSLTFTKVMAKGVHEGSFMVTSPFTAMATFHAEWCQGGTEY